MNVPAGFEYIRGLLAKVTPHVCAIQDAKSINHGERAVIATAFLEMGSALGVLTSIVEQAATSANGHTLPSPALSGGMPLRDYFAGKAVTVSERCLGGHSSDDILDLLGLDLSTQYDYRIHYPQALAKYAYLIADAMLTERAKGGR